MMNTKETQFVIRYYQVVLKSIVQHAKKHGANETTELKLKDCLDTLNRLNIWAIKLRKAV